MSQESILKITPPQKKVKLNLKELLTYRDLIWILTYREIKIRYKQRIVGSAWAIIQPVVTMIIFSVLFGQLMKTPTEGIPYPIFSYTALVPWSFFTHALTKSTTCLRLNSNLITKVYFPRLILPIVAVLGALIDFLIAFSVLILMMFFYGIVPTYAIIFTPFFILLTILTVLSISLWLSAINVEYRDIENLLPFIIQTGLFITPIAYSSKIIPEKFQLLYALNPMAGVVEGFRWALLGQGDPPSLILAISTSVVLLLLVSGLYFFKKKEDFFADVI